jgi:tetratricopeptide (TPR) repeat protein/ADP-heptose:LPS heptosyltransferase
MHHNKYVSNINIKDLYRQLEKNPKDINLNIALAYLNRKSGNLEHALFLCRNALKVDKNSYGALYEQARIFTLQNKYILACKNYQQIYIHHKDKYEYLADWHQCLLNSNNNLDKFKKICLDLISIFRKTNNDVAVIYCYEQLMLINSYQVDNKELKNLYIRNNQHQKAEQLFTQELEKNPQDTDLLVSYASFLHDTDRLIEAKEACNKAIALDKNYYYAYNRLSFILKELKDFQGCKNAILKALELSPNDNLLFHLSLLELVLGNYEKGWKLYNYHNSVEKPNTPHYISELLFDNTQNLENKVLCLWLDLGLGDAIKFMRYIPLLGELVKQKGGTMVCSIFNEFSGLFHKNYSQYFTEISNRFYKPHEEFDYQIQISRLPELFKTTLETIPNQIPYLEPSEQALIKHKHILKNDKNFKVGLVWAGSKNHTRDNLRSISIDNYILFKDIEGISFYSFQFGKPQDIEYAKNHGLNIIDLTPNIKNFDESAAIFQQLDLLITVDTSACHLAGALGIPTWLLADVAPHYVWLLERSDSPWYPNTTIYRQTKYKNWQPILEKLHQDLKEKVKNYYLLNHKSNKLLHTTAQTYSIAIVIATVCRLNSIQILIGVDQDINNNFLIIKQILDDECPNNIKIIWLNLGYSTSKRHGGVHDCYFGGSLRSALSMLANSELVMYLDDDDWLHCNHISNVMKVIDNNSWAFAYSIYSDSNKGIGICIDELESVGVDKGIFAKSHGGFVRPSGLLINKIKLMHILYLWSCSPYDSGDGEDRLIFEKLRLEPHACTNIPSVYYSLDRKDGMHSVRIEFIKSKNINLDNISDKIGSVR